MRNELYRCRVCGKVLTERLDDKRKPRKFSN
nr:MAG TPA: desulforedoxin type protein [Caudoviricetes sp.]